MSGYAATLAYSVTGNRSGGFPGLVKTQDSAAQSPLLKVSGFTVAVIWEDLMPTLNHTSANMRYFPKKIFGVQEEHPMMANFDGEKSLAGLIYRVEDIYNNTDNGLFRFEKK